MKQLFYDNPLQKNFVADITNIYEKNNLYYITLNQTLFYFGGGGQSFDTGTIAGIEVIEVFEENGDTVHVLKNKPKVLQDIECEINYKNRIDRMEQHLAQHIISGCFNNIFNANTCGFHLGADISTVDILGTITKEQVLEVEKKSNEIIRNNIKVKSYVPSLEELERLQLRRDLPDTQKEIRVLEIKDFDINACCGVHFDNTQSVLLIKIKKFEKYKGNTRIEYLAGKRAVDYVLKRDLYLDNICKHLSSNEDTVFNAINNLEEKINSYASENKILEEKLIKYDTSLLTAKKINDIIVYNNIFDENIVYVKKIAEYLLKEDNTVVLFASKEDKMNYLFSCSKNLKNLDMSKILKDVLNLTNGKGGGNKFLAQGFSETINDDIMAYADDSLRRNL